MYKEFFGLEANPFNVSPDPRYLFLNQQTEEALACLIYGIESRKGFILLTGEVGTGKTTLVNKVLSCLRQQGIATAFVFNPTLNGTELLNYMLADFGVSCESHSKDEILRHLNHWLLEQYSAGSTAVVIIDEAQNLSSDALEEIRLLTNLETFTEKLLQVVLVGQPEMEEKLKQPELRQLMQRIAMRARTERFCREEAGAYIHDRLQRAGSREAIFADTAIAEIHRYSRGIPRVINLICEHCLINAFADEQRMISVDIVETVAREFDYQKGDAAESGFQVIRTPKPVAKVDMSDLLKTFGAWLASYGRENLMREKLIHEPNPRRVKES